MIRIIKSKRTLEYLDNEGRTLLALSISLGKCPEGKKTREGDMKTPEGAYKVTHINRESKYHIALGISYPNKEDAKSAYSEGRIRRLDYLRIAVPHALGIRPSWNTPLGGFIMIHGEHPDKLSGDWTAGCIAVTNAGIEALTSMVKRGEPVEILP